MATLTSQLIVSLIDRVTAPARGIAATVDRLQDAQRRNNARMDEMRGRMVDAAAMAYAMARSVGAPVRAAADFETAMNRVTALSGASGEQFDQLRQQALELGRSTQFTASQAGDAMGFLAMAGFKANEILGAMPGTLQLASAAQMDLAQTADVVSNILTGYGKDVSELAHVNDVLVKAFTSANTDLSQLAEAMKYAGPIASAAGVRFEETAAAISLMGNAGIQGSMAGTSLRGALTRILNPTSGVASAMQEAGLSFTDARGRLLPFADIIEQLEPHAEDAGLMMQLFGQRAGPAMAALVGQGSDALRELDEELRNSGGTAERISNVQMAGFNGMMKEFWSVVEGVQIAIGTALLPAMTDMGRTMIALLGPIAAFAEANPRLTATIVGLVSALVALRVAVVAAQFAFLWMKGGAISAAILSMRTLQGALWATQLAFLPFTAALRGARTAMVGYTAAAAIAGHGGALSAMGASMLALLNPIRLVRAAMLALRVALISTGIGAIVVGIAMAGAWIWQNWQGLGEMFAGIAEGISEAFPAAGAIIDGISSSVSTLIGWFGEMTGPIDASAEDWRGWGTAVGQAVGGVLQYVADLPGRIAGALAAGGVALYEAGTALIQAMWDGIKAKFDEVLAWFRELPGRIIAAIGSIDLSGIIRWPSMPSWLGGGGPAVDGARAAGGPITRGRAYLVGEEGPEIITAGSDGYVHDAGASRDMMRREGGRPGSAGGRDIAISFGDIVIQGVSDPRAIARDLVREVDRQLRAEIAGLQADSEWGTA
ncbi:phage tail tape measure protein [Chelativorans sp. ZYF759]|uniref:phage tail tape measure protein n=1 Tax=Chelativorans sp. ZYF759 TaxID=2692213 RepID=UPI00145E2BD8|nr:phage tail tape measure protein [Chelativorans sp. ZYF759]NMG39793.1 phage tail tape measure protein [Chelativorans sp. ZYF759]